MRIEDVSTPRCRRDIFLFSSELQWLGNAPSNEFTDQEFDGDDGVECDRHKWFMPTGAYLSAVLKRLAWHSFFSSSSA